MAVLPLTIGPPLLVLIYCGVLRWRMDPRWPFADKSEAHRLALAIVALANVVLGFLFWKALGTDLLGWWHWPVPVRDLSC